MDNRPPIKDFNNIAGLAGLGPLPSSAPVASFNLEQVESLLKTKGIKAYHYKSAPNPVRESVEMGTNVNTQGATRGVIYYEVRELRVVPQSFKLDQQLTVRGLYDLQSVVLNVSGQYYDHPENCQCGNDHVYLKPRDLIVLNPTITVAVEQMVQYNPNGPIRLQYRCKGVDLMLSASGVKYVQGQDFVINDGLIYWTPGGRKPSFLNGKGEVLSLVYWATPIYVVKDLPHLFRVLPDNSTGEGALPRHAHYAPQLVIASASHLRDEKDRLDFFDLPPYPGYANTLNVTGGT